MNILTKNAHWFGVCAIGAAAAGLMPHAVRGQAPAPAPAATAAPGPRAANAPPLVAVTAARDGNFRIAPPYVDDPAFTEKPDVPKGRVIRFTMNSADSKIFPTAPPARGAGGAGRGGRGAAPENAPAAAPTPPQPFDRQIAVYIPAGYVPNTPAPFIVVQDERWYVKEDAPEGRTDLAFMPTMLDNLIQQKRVPAMVAVMLWPGPGGQRSIEYDTISDRYLNFIDTEVLPRITRDYQVAFTTDPDGRATFGESSGSPAALSMAWLYPNLYRRVISYSGHVRGAAAQCRRA